MSVFKVDSLSTLKAVAFLIVICSLVSAGALAGEPTKGVMPLPAEILQKAEAAIKNAKIVRLTFTREGLHADAETSPRIHGTAIMSGYERMFIKKFRIDAKTKKPGEQTTENLVAGADGDVFYVVDEKTKKVHVDMDPAVMGSIGQTIVFDLLPTTFVNPDPFEYEKKVEKPEVKGIVKIDGEEYYEVQFVFAGGKYATTQFFSVKDGLPRRIEWNYKLPTGESGGSRLVISELTLDYKAPPDVFTPTIPDGFTRTEEFAP
ncbi:MAG: hypothetical protein AABZ47_15875 [Planctomycetota bacterium]